MELKVKLDAAIKKVHLRLWEEMQAPCGKHLNDARNKREQAEKELRSLLATYNPRDVYKRED